MEKFVKSALVVVATTMLFMGTLYIPLVKKYNNLYTKNNRLEKEIECFKEYYISAEHLLDEIFQDYSWADYMDPIYYYDAVDMMYEEDILPLGEH